MIKKYLSRIQRSAIFKNFLSLSIAELISRSVSLITFAYLARILSPKGFGIIAFASAFVFYFSLLVNFGLDTYGTREIAIGSYLQSKFVNTIITLRLLFAVLLFVVLTITAILFSQSLVTKVALIISGINLFSTAISIDWYFQGIQKMKSVAARQIGVSILNFVLILGFVRNQNDVLIAVLITGVSLFINSGLLLKYYSNSFHKISLEYDAELIKKIIIESAPIALSSVMIAIYYNLDIVMLGYMKSDYEVGIYNAAVKLFLIGNILYGLILKSFFPALSVSNKNVKKLIDDVFKKYFIAMLTTGIFISVIMYSLSGDIINLVYGERYNPASNVLKILAMNSAVVCINMIFGNPLLAWGLQCKYFLIVGTGAIINIILNVTLIPKYSYIGAGVATLFSEAAVFTALFLIYNFSLKAIDEI